MLPDGDAVVCGVAHYLVLDLLPAFQISLDEDLVDGAGSEMPPAAMVASSSRVRAMPPPVPPRV